MGLLLIKMIASYFIAPLTGGLIMIRCSYT